MRLSTSSIAFLQLTRDTGIKKGSDTYRCAIITGRLIYRSSRNSFYIRDRCNFGIERVLSASLGCEISPRHHKRKR